MTNKERFVEIFQTKVKREGADKLLAFLLSDASDFFRAPASTRYHGAYEGGLLEHSLNVYDNLCDYLARNRVKDVYGFEYSEEMKELPEEMKAFRFEAEQFISSSREHFDNVVKEILRRKK